MSEKIVHTNKNGFIFKDVGNKLDYGIFHSSINGGKKLLGWIRKFCIKYQLDKN